MKAFFTKAVAKKILGASLFIVVLSALFIVPKLSIGDEHPTMRWSNLPIVLVFALLVSSLYQYLQFRQKNSHGAKERERRINRAIHSVLFRKIVIAACTVLLAFPLVLNLFGIYLQYGQAPTQYLTLAFIYIIFSLGLNIIVGLSGMLCLGQAFFLAVGAYTYGILNTIYGVNFYVGLLCGIVMGTIFGLLFALVTLRLRGDYLAIVTLGLSEIFRLIMINLDFTGGPRGISGIDKPFIPGIDFNLFGQTRLLYYVAFALVCLSIFLIRRLEHSRFGRSWEAMREDEIASSAMGINISLVRLGVFSINGLLGGIAGVLFAANTTFIDPNSFSITVSITALSITVLGGLGSISGVILGTAVLIVLPEYLRFFSEYRMLMLGAILLFMMLFCPNGIIPKSRTEFLLEEE